MTLLASDLLYEIAVELYRKAQLDFNPPPDVVQRFKEYSDKETGMAKDVYRFWFSEYDKVKAKGEQVCMDSGTNIFYITVGTKAKVDPKIDWWGTFARAAIEATKKGYISPISHNPITRENTQLNVGIGHPWLEFNWAPEEDIVEVTCVPRGGGAEFGTAYKMMVPADGIKGVRKWVVDMTALAVSGGKVCPPNIIGVGIGGHSGLTTKLAFDAAALRPVGSRHPVDWISKLEEDLLKDINSLGIGPMGVPGKTVALDVHVEMAWAHGVCLPVALNTHCMKASRATARIHPDSRVEYDSYPKLWFKELRRTASEYKELAALAVKGR